MNPYFKKFAIILLSIYILYNVNCCTHFCRVHKRMDQNDTNATKNVTYIKASEATENDICFNHTYDPGEVDNHLPQNECSYCENFKGKIINPFKNRYKHYSDKNNFGSACLKCAACLAIAENMNETFNDLILRHGDAEPDFLKQCCCDALNYLCLKGFKNYDLRKVNGATLLTDVSVYSEHVQSHMDGLWTETLRDLCTVYVKNMDLCNVFNRYRSGTITFTTYLCKGDGIFRDCNNIDVKYVKVPDLSKEVQVKVCVNC